MYSGNVHSLSRYLFDIDVNNSSTDIETYYNFIDSNNLSDDAKLFLTLKTHRMQENGGNNQHTLESASFPRNWSTFTVVNLGKDPNYFSKEMDIYGNYTQLDSQSLVDLYNTDLKENTQPVIALKTVHNTFLSVTPGRNIILCYVFGFSPGVDHKADANTRKVISCSKCCRPDRSQKYKYRNVEFYRGMIY